MILESFAIEEIGHRTQRQLSSALKRPPLRRFLSLAVAIALPASGFSQDKRHLALEAPWASFVEKDFPFFGHALDARKLGGGWPADNLTPRGVILDLGEGVHACFDTDMVRLALVWRETGDGEWLTMTSMAAGSYRLPQQKASAGQDNLPVALGTPLLANGLYPGWFAGDAEPSLGDPRDRGTAQEGELGLGPLPAEWARWTGLRMEGGGVRLEYEVAGTPISERLTYRERDGGLIRELRIGPHNQPLKTVTGRAVDGKPAIATFPPSDSEKTLLITHNGAKVSPGESPRTAPTPRWTKALTTSAKPLPAPSPFALVEIDQPTDNPWKRSLRLSGFDFFDDGRAALCTFDGDVWIAKNLTDKLDRVEWRRVASGLHEPMGLTIVDGRIYTSGRNGVMRLHDEDGDGEIDHYEVFCNRVPQTAETREFAMDIYAKPGGGFYIAKGGQIGTTWGKYNGTIIEIEADGKSFERIGFGLRQPYIGVDPLTGMVTSSDQQGNWVPATPIHVVSKGDYFGFRPEPLKDKAVHPKEITEPPVWIPHFINSSGASQVWLRDASMGPLNDSLIHIGFNRPEIFKIYFDESGAKRQGAVAPVLSGFPSGLLKGRVNPLDGSLWLAGLKIWGTPAEQITGLYRVRHTDGPCWIPTDIRSSDRGVLLRFAQEVDPAIATSLASYTVDRWNYLRTHNYGSGNYKLDGSPGQESLPVANAYVSRDKRAVFLGIPNMRPVHSMRVTYRVPDPTGRIPPTEAIQHAYLTIHQNNPIDLEREGFGDQKIDLTLKAGANLTMAAPDPSIEIGQQVYQTYGCIACHTVDGTTGPGLPIGDAADAIDQAKVVVGPTWLGLWGSKKRFTDGSELKAVDETYLRESIVDPARRVQEGFDQAKTGVGMPSYLGVLKDHEIDSVILYIKSLAKKPAKKKK